MKCFYINYFLEFDFKIYNIYRDIFSVFQNTDALELLNNILKKYAVELSGKVDCVAMLEARGFLLGTLMALYLNVPCIPVRKKGKLPGKVAQLEYSLEYAKVIMFFVVEFILDVLIIPKTYCTVWILWKFLRFNSIENQNLDFCKSTNMLYQ